MKNKYFFTLITASLFTIAGFSQIDIAPTYGYNFGANNSGYYSDIKMKGNSTLGLNVQIKLDGFTGVQLSYTYTNSHIKIKD